MSKRPTCAADLRRLTFQIPLRLGKQTAKNSNASAYPCFPPKKENKSMTDPTAVVAVGMRVGLFCS